MGRKEREEARRAFWRGHVDGWRLSGETQRAYCERHGLKRYSLSYWQLRFGGTVGGGGRLEAVTPLTLVPAQYVPAADAGGRLSVTSPTGWHLEFDALPATDWLRELCGGRA